VYLITAFFSSLLKTPNFFKTIFSSSEYVLRLFIS